MHIVDCARERRSEHKGDKEHGGGRAKSRQLDKIPTRFALAREAQRTRLAGIVWWCSASAFWLSSKILKLSKGRVSNSKG